MSGELISNEKETQKGEEEAGIGLQIVKGALSGLMATIPMTVSMLLMHRLLPR